MFTLQCIAAREYKYKIVASREGSAASALSSEASLILGWDWIRHTPTSLLIHIAVSWAQRNWLSSAQSKVTSYQYKVGGYEMDCVVDGHNNTIKGSRGQLCANPHHYCHFVWNGPKISKPTNITVAIPCTLIDCEEEEEEFDHKPDSVHPHMWTGGNGTPLPLPSKLTKYIYFTFIGLL